jgi:hypothetical protein
MVNKQSHACLSDTLTELADGFGLQSNPRMCGVPHIHSPQNLVPPFSKHLRLSDEEDFIIFIGLL